MLRKIISLLIISCLAMNTACSRISTKSETSVKKTMGEQHNSMLSYYYQQAEDTEIREPFITKNGHISQVKFAMMMEAFSAWALQNGFTAQEVEEGLQEVNTMLTNIGIKQTINNEEILVLQADTILKSYQYARNTKPLQPKTIELLDPIMDDYANGKDLAVIEEKILAINQDYDLFNQETIVELHKFTDVYFSSKDFWSADLHISGSTEVIIADTVGALVGSVFGGIGSIIYCGAYSAMWNEYVESDMH